MLKREHRCAAIAATLLLAGCGGGKPDDAGGASAGTDSVGPVAAAAAAVDPCSFLSVAEVQAIRGDPVSGATSDGDSCTYRSNPENLVVTVALTGGRDRMATMRRANGMMEGMGGAVADKGGAGQDAAALLKQDKDAPRIGDEAMWGTPDILAVRKGDAYVEVMPPIMHDPSVHSGYPIVPKEEKRAIAMKVAAAVLVKLKG